MRVVSVKPPPIPRRDARYTRFLGARDRALEAPAFAARHSWRSSICRVFWPEGSYGLNRSARSHFHTCYGPVGEGRSSILTSMTRALAGPGWYDRPWNIFMEDNVRGGMRRASPWSARAQ